MTKVERNDLTTFFTQAGSSKTRGVPIIHSQISYKVKNILRKREIKVTSTRRPHQLKTRLGSVKNPKEDSEKSGIFQITCTYCEKPYIGQIRRLITTKFNERIREANLAKVKSRSTHVLKSFVARHMIEENDEG